MNAKIEQRHIDRADELITEQGGSARFTLVQQIANADAAARNVTAWREGTRPNIAALICPDVEDSVDDTETEQETEK